MKGKDHLGDLDVDRSSSLQCTEIFRFRFQLPISPLDGQHLFFLFVGNRWFVLAFSLSSILCRCSSVAGDHLWIQMFKNVMTIPYFEVPWQHGWRNSDEYGKYQ
jgi:hypothetical protein